MPDERLHALITALSDPHPAARSRAANDIFATGARLASAAIEQWQADSELRSCMRFAGPPQITVGVAVEAERFDAIRAVNGNPALADVPPEQDAKEFELDLPGGVRLDVLTSRGPGGDGAIARYLKKFGEGIQQVEVKVTDVDRATEILRSRFGIQPIYPKTRDGANGTRVNFFLVAIAGGGKLLVELVEA